MPSSNPTVITHLGALDASAVNDINNAMVAQLFAITTPVTQTNPTSATTLMTATIGLTSPLSANNSLVNAPLNVAGKGIEVYCAGTYSCGTSSTLTFDITLGGVTMASWATASQTTTATTLNWNISMVATTVQIGSAGTMECHGTLTFDSGSTLAAAASSFQDSNTAVITAIPMNAPMVLNCQALFGSTSGSNTITQRLMQVFLLG